MEARIIQIIIQHCDIEAVRKELKTPWERIKFELLRQGKSANWLRDKTKLPDNYISQMMFRNRGYTNSARLVVIADALGVSLRYLSIGKE